MIRRLKRIRCWLRGYHITTASAAFKFRYDVSGVCHDCGIVGDGKRGEGGE